MTELENDTFITSLEQGPMALGWTEMVFWDMDKVVEGTGGG